MNWIQSELNDIDIECGSEKPNLDGLPVDVIHIGVVELGGADDDAAALFGALNFDVDRWVVLVVVATLRSVPLRSVHETKILHFLLQSKRNVIICTNRPPGGARGARG